MEERCIDFALKLKTPLPIPDERWAVFATVLGEWF